MNKNAIKIISGVIILGGVYLVIRSFMKKNDSGIAPLQPEPNKPQPTPTPTPTPTIDKSFPIKKGDRDSGAPLNPKGKVVNLQKLINQKGYLPLADKFKGKSLIKLTADGIFGSKTEEAVMFYTNKKSIDNQADLNYLNNVINPSISSFGK